MKRLPTFLVPVGAAAAGLPTVVAPGTTVAHTSYLCAFSALVVLAWWRSRSLSGPAFTAYALIAGALTSWLAGDLLYAVLVWRVGDLGGVSPADVLWILGYPLLAAGLIRMTRLRAPGRLRAGLLDAIAMATVVASLFWQFMILPAVEAESLSLSVVFGAFYPFGDVLLFATAVILVLSPGSRRGPTRYLIAALALAFLGDVTISAASTLFPALDSERLDGLLLLTNGLFVAALVHPDVDLLTARSAGNEQRLHPARVVFLGVALLALPTMFGVRNPDSLVARASLLISMIVLTVTVLIRFLLVVREQERIREALAHRATHDQLTGLANRQELRSRLEDALRHPRPFGPVLHFLDLNGFKQINDEYGHAAGDFVLIEFARRLRAEVGPADTVARLGGDEFVVLSETIGDHEAAIARTERLRGVVAEPMGFAGDLLSVGVSIGMATATDLAQPSSDSLVAAADATMYIEKSTHRQSRRPHARLVLDGPGPLVSSSESARSPMS